MDVKLLVLCGVRIADLAWARERDKVVAMAGSRVWGDIVRFGVVVLCYMLYKYVQYYTGEGKPCAEKNQLMFGEG